MARNICQALATDGEGAAAGAGGATGAGGAAAAAGEGARRFFPLEDGRSRLQGLLTAMSIVRLAILSGPIITNTPLAKPKR